MNKREIYERIANLIEGNPCLYVDNEIVVKDSWCEEHCVTATSAECWKHAIKEGWK